MLRGGSTLLLIVLALPAHARAAETDAPAPASPAPESADPAAAPQLHLEVTLQHREQLQSSMRELDQERGSTPRLWPVLTFSTGIGVGLGAGIYGMATAQSCDQPTCTTSPAIGVTVVAGLLVGAAGLIWWLKVEERLDRIAQQRMSLKRELDYIEWNQAADLSPAPPLSASLRLRY